MGVTALSTHRYISRFNVFECTVLEANWFFQFGVSDFIKLRYCTEKAVVLVKISVFVFRIRVCSPDKHIPSQKKLDKKICLPVQRAIVQPSALIFVVLVASPGISPGIHYFHIYRICSSIPDLIID